MKVFSHRVVSCKFLDQCRGNYRFMSYYGKQAHGLTPRIIVEKQIETIKGLRFFNNTGYRYSTDRSDKNTLVFNARCFPVLT